MGSDGDLRTGRRSPTLEEALAPLSLEHLDEIEGAALALLKAFPRPVVRRGHTCAQRVGVIRFDPDAWVVVAPVQGRSPLPYEVELLLSPDDDGEIDCTCPYAEREGPCKHAWAMAYRLVDAVGKERERRARRSPSRAPRRRREARPRASAARRAAEEAQARALRDLDDLLLRAREPALAAAGPERSTRIVWHLGLANGRVAVTPFEQKLRQNGTYTPGRRLSLSDMGPYRYDTRADVRGIARLASISGSSWWGSARSDERLDPARALTALAGSPFVVAADAPARAVTIERGRLGLRIAPTEASGVSLRLSLSGAGLERAERLTLYGDAVVARDDPLSRVVFAMVQERARPLAERLVTAGGIAVPPGARAAILERISDLERVLPVSVDEALLGPPLPTAPPRLILRLSERPAGLQAEVRIAPPAVASGVDPLIPGEGSSRALVLDGDALRPLERDLAEERARARALAADLGLDAASELADRPFTYALDDLGAALDVLAAARSIAEDPGRGVVVEESRDAPRLSGSATSGQLRVRIRSQRDWFHIDGDVDGEGFSLPLVHALEAARNGLRFVQLADGSYVRLAQSLRERLDALDVLVRSRRGDQLEVSRAAGPLVGDALGDVPIEGDPAWKRALQRFEAAALVDATPPTALRAELRPYQAEGLRWLRRMAAWGVGACLADDMGLGKTLQGLALLLDRAEGGPALVVAPTSVGFNWVREAGRFAPSLRPRLFRGPGRDLEGVGPGDLVVTSYEIARRDVERLRSIEWETLVLDEAQKVKNGATRTAAAVRTIPAGWRLALTGTPVENHLGELWSLFRVLEPGLLGSWEHFRERFASPIERDGDARRREALARVIRPFVLRRAKDDVLTDLPARAEQVLEVTLSSAERARYDEVRVAAVAELEGRAAGDEAGARFAVLAALTRLRQLACHPRLYDDRWRGSSAKLDRFLELVEELRDGGHRALVFSQFTSHLALLREALDRAGVAYQYLDGRTPARKRAERVDAFQAGEGDLFLISLKAGGTGLNLTAADYVVHMDPWWNPAVEDQATDRAHRIGQTRPVTVYRLVTRGTIEEEILALHESKRDLVAGVLAGSDRAGALSTEDLLALIRGGDGPSESGAGAGRARSGRGRASARSDDRKRPPSAQPQEPSRKRSAKRRRARGTATRAATVEPKGPRSAAHRARAGRTSRRSPDDEPTASARLRAVRAALGLTQAEMGTSFGVSAPTVCRWERGGRAIPSEALRILDGLAAKAGGPREGRTRNGRRAG